MFSADAEMNNKAALQDVSRRGVIRLQDVSKHFNGQLVLDRISCELGESQVILLRGSNGAGKTTLVNILCGFLAPDSGTWEFRGRGGRVALRFPQPWWHRLAMARFRPDAIAKMGITRTWQDTRLFPNHTLWENIALATPGQVGENPLWALGRPGKVRTQHSEVLSSAGELLKGLGLPGRANSTADQLSLGESKRVAIARSLATRAGIIVLDEPLSGLDASGVRSLIRTLEQLTTERRVTLLIIEHLLNVPRLLPLATQVWTLNDGRLEIDTPANVGREYSALASDAFTAALVGPGIQVERRDLGGGARLIVLSHPQVGAVALDLADVVVRRGSRAVAGARQQDGSTLGLSISLRFGQTGILEAPNGWGKSSLMMAIAGLIPASGSIHITGQLLGDLPGWRRARLGLGMLQSRDNSFPGLAVKEVLQLSGLSGRDFGSVFEHRKVASLSSGEQQKLSIACFRARNVSVALLDEPWAALDARGLEAARELMIPRPDRACLVSMPTGYEEQ
jgi:ABC-type branched-subunit amino acid transport system ATPase component